jgi:cell division protein FtsZ
MTLHEVNDSAVMIQEAAHDDANIIFGAVIDERMGDNIRITVIATGFGKVAKEEPRIVMPREVVRPKAPPQYVGRLEDESVGVPVVKLRDVDSMEFRKRVKELGLDAFEEDEYDIPTFLRKQVD